MNKDNFVKNCHRPAQDAKMTNQDKDGASYAPKSILMQINHNDFDGKDYIQIIQSGCVILEVPLVKEQEHEGLC